ncbi:MAG: hypothetical protein LBQ00_07585 [Syntrophobacterales bacterium]|jgi:aminopeptidase N|nr:hypothetical protein [Syntrophobacterales bacterium]
MAEIKSAIELAMERTRNLIMDDHEKREFQKKDLENRVRALLRRYLEGITEMDRAMTEMDEIEAEPRFKQKFLVNLLIEDLDITKENGRALDLLHLVGNGLSGRIVARLDEIRDEFVLEMEKKKSVVRSKIESRLEGMGIAGNGLDINVEAWEEWDDARAKTGLIFRKQVDEWKERLVKTLDKD